MYQVIARKYRPQSFGELIGQEHVQKTLSNAIESRRIAHGYIFSGQRGTGKTTVARILARCLNCVNGPTATPCGVCSSCLEITAGSSVDVIEIDAASNRGINEMREIRENVRYRPARDRYKIFIIDEAHQITKDAFNALLKTLEEPPEWVVFILCTTEANEIPSTIASRCQHFTFRSVEFSELVARMRFIAEQEGIEASDEVLSVIAQAGEGSVRDSLSALDQAIACCGHTLDVQNIRSLLGIFDVDSLEAVPLAINENAGVRMLEIVQELESSGKSMQHFCRELARYWRNLLVSKISGKPTRLIAASDMEQMAFLRTAALFSEEDLTRYLNLTLDLYKTMQYSLQPKLHLELGLVKLVQAGRLVSIERALAELGPATPEKTTVPTPALTATSRAGAPRPASFQVPSAPKLDAAAGPVAAPKPPPAETQPAVVYAPRPEPPPQQQSPSAPNTDINAGLQEPSRAGAPRPASFQEPSSPKVEATAPVPAPKPPAATPPPVVSAPRPEPPQQQSPSASKTGSGDIKADLQEALRAASLAFSADAVAQADVELKGNELSIRAPKAMLLALRDAAVQKIAASVVGRPVRVKVEAGENMKVSAPGGASSSGETGADSGLRERALSHPGVKRFQELFPGAQVRTVRNLNE